MQGMCIQSHARAACDHAFIIQCVYVRNYLHNIKHNCNIYLETVAKLSNRFLNLFYCSFYEYLFFLIVSSDCYCMQL